VSPDLLSVTLRAAAFVCLFQAAGAALFVVLFGGLLVASRPTIVRIARLAALVAAPLLLAHAAIEAARMAGDYAGIADPGLQRLGWYSADGVAQSLQAAGALCIAAALRSDEATPVRAAASGRWRWQSLALVGVLLALLPFLFTGHTSVHSLRALLAPLLAVHVLIVAFWFGALAPLYAVLARESAEVAVQIMRAFSAIATWLVPLIVVAGVALACVLAPGIAVLRQPYGELLLVKLAGFAVLMGLAALNRSRLVPALSSRQRREPAARMLRWSLAAEVCLLCAVLSVTAVLTTFYSPHQ
jgi:putative copper resistance protein D